LVITFEESFVDEIVGLDAREGEGEIILFVVPGEGGIGQELRSGAPYNSLSLEVYGQHLAKPFRQLNSLLFIKIIS
jgi:hypothetical protein